MGETKWDADRVSRGFGLVKFSFCPHVIKEATGPVVILFICLIIGAIFGVSIVAIAFNRVGVCAEGIIIAVGADRDVQQTARVACQHSCREVALHNIKGLVASLMGLEAQVTDVEYDTSGAGRCTVCPYGGTHILADRSPNCQEPFAADRVRYFERSRSGSRFGCGVFCLNESHTP